MGTTGQKTPSGETKKKQPVGLLIEKKNQKGTSITVFRLDKPSTEYLVFCPAFETLADGMPNV
jgi:hypothetical protein